LGGLGWLFWVGTELLDGSWKVRHLVWGALVSPLVLYIKAYLLIAFILAGSAAYMLKRAQARQKGVGVLFKPLHVLGVALLALGITHGIGEMFPRFALSNLAEEAAQMQAIGQRTTGGSNYMFGDPTEQTLAGQLTLAPFALATSLFRPFIFEVHNALSFTNALETTAILLLFIVILRRSSLRSLYGRVFGSPPLLFCLVFTLVLALGVGLTTTNLGTLSRYRMPMMPFYLSLLLSLLPMRSTIVSRPVGRQPVSEKPRLWKSTHRRSPSQPTGHHP